VAFLKALAVADGHQAVLKFMSFADVVMDVAVATTPTPISLASVYRFLLRPASSGARFCWSSR
jgi:hypothetical protein